MSVGKVSFSVSLTKWKVRVGFFATFFLVLVFYFSMTASRMVPKTPRHRMIAREPQSIEASFVGDLPTNSINPYDGEWPITVTDPHVMVFQERGWVNRLQVGLTNAGIFTGNAVSYPVRIYLFRGGVDNRTHFQYISYVK
jgi:hypothetical protein